MSKNTWQVLRKGAMLKGSSVTVTEDLSRWAWHLLFSVQLRENNLWKFTCWWDFVCCCWSVKVKIEHVAKVKVLMSGVFDNVEQSSESSCAMSKRGTLLPRCYLLLQFLLSKSFLCCTTIFTTILQNEMIPAGTPAVWQALRWWQVLCLEWSQRKGDQSWKLCMISFWKTYIFCDGHDNYDNTNLMIRI